MERSTVSRTRGILIGGLYCASFTQAQEQALAGGNMVVPCAAHVVNRQASEQTFQMIQCFFEM